MKKLIVILIPILVVCAAVLLVSIFLPTLTKAPEAGAPTTKLMSIESFVTINISELSPVKEQLGGKFYVTHIEVDRGKGEVSYEDGHNAYTADFTYEASDQTGIHITSFVIRS